MIQLHVRAPPGTRIEVTEQIFQAVEDKIREVIPKKDLDLIVDNFGVPARSYNWAFADGTTIAVNDGVIMVSLKEGHAPTADYIRKLREVLPAAFPANMFYFQPADMATQILNFGLTAQINVRTVGYDRVKNLRIAEELRRRIAAIPGVVDAHLQQEVYAPDFYVQIDRARALQFGITASDIGNNVNTSLSFVRAGVAQFLDRSDKRDSLLHRGADTGIPGALAGRPRQYAGQHRNRAADDPACAGRAQQCRNLHARRLQCCGDASSAGNYEPGENLSASHRPIRRRDNPAEHQRRQLDHGRSDERHFDVLDGSQRRDPRLDLRAAG